MSSFRTRVVLVAAVPLMVAAGAAGAVGGSTPAAGGSAGPGPTPPTGASAAARAVASPPPDPTGAAAGPPAPPGQGPPASSAANALDAMSGEPTPPGRWRSPTAPRPVVARPFGVGPNPWSPGHRGADLTAARGSPVVAPAAGVVTFAGTVVDRPVLVITHPGRLVTSLEPVAAGVRRGDEVGAGQPVGRMAQVGPTHCFPSTCLHWGVRDGGRYIDPMTLLGLDARRIVLLPLGS